MSIVIIGGHERMETQYKQICKQYKCKAKVFTKMKTDLKNKIGSPDLLISGTFPQQQCQRIKRNIRTICIISEQSEIEMAGSEIKKSQADLHSKT